MSLIELHWENPSNHRYYQAIVEQDLLGDLVLTQRWGTQGTRLGGHQTHVCRSYAEAVQQCLALHQQRLQHGYQLMQSHGLIGLV